MESTCFLGNRLLQIMNVLALWLGMATGASAALSTAAATGPGLQVRPRVGWRDNPDATLAYYAAPGCAVAVVDVSPPLPAGGNLAARVLATSQSLSPFCKNTTDPAGRVVDALGVSLSGGLVLASIGEMLYGLELVGNSSSPTAAVPALRVTASRRIGPSGTGNAASKIANGVVDRGGFNEGKKEVFFVTWNSRGNRLGTLLCYTFDKGRVSPIAWADTGGHGSSPKSQGVLGRGDLNDAHPIGNGYILVSSASVGLSVLQWRTDTFSARSTGWSNSGTNAGVAVAGTFGYPTLTLLVAAGNKGLKVFDTPGYPLKLRLIATSSWDSDEKGFASAVAIASGNIAVVASDCCVTGFTIGADQTPKEAWSVALPEGGVGRRSVVVDNAFYADGGLARVNKSDPHTKAQGCQAFVSNGAGGGIVVVDVCPAPGTEPTIVGWLHSPLRAVSDAVDAPLGNTACTGNSTHLPAAQCAAWVAFHAATGGAKTWSQCATMGTDPCSCKPYGKFPVCNDDGDSVVQLYLYQVGLQGVLPPEIGAWSDLKSVQLSGNRLTGELPSEMGNWTQLEEFYAYNNALSGSVPVSVAQWTHLRVFVVFNNALTGSLPSGLGPGWEQLQVFNVDLNRLTGRLPSLPFAALEQCDLLNHPHGGANAFACPWPENVTAVCRKMAQNEQHWVGITDADCTR
jgi:hypothetical protein